jgi:crotonobetainyl-CoA:carnitine CoA-transferase CaiB-like acyl-CoA transferase
VKKMNAQDNGTAAALPLAGIKVVECGQNIAGPFAGEILASLGADVVKVERPEGGDDARGWGPPFWRGTATTFQAMNHGKRGITVDLKDAESVRWLKNYIAGADVLIQNLRPGVMEELGFSAEALLAENPRLIYCSLWAFGHKGPMYLKPGYEPMVQAFTGLFAVNGTEDGPPSRVGMQILDLGTGVWAALGTIAALFRRHTTGKGCVVDASLFETGLGWLGVLLAGYGASGKQPPRHRSGNPRVVVFQSFETNDGEVVVAAANDRLFAKLARELGHPEWASDARFASNALRVEHKADLLPEISRIFKTQTMAHWMERLEAIGIPCSPIHDFKQVLAEPQTEALGILQEIPDLDLRVVSLPLSFNRRRPPVRHRAPELGEHNAEIGAPASKKEPPQRAA